jgi:hypothetical protein
MTLIPFTPDRLDALALRLLDLSATFRDMANQCRDEKLAQFKLHDKKAGEWLAKLERWTDESVRRFDLAVMRNRGARLAKQLSSGRRDNRQRTSYFNTEARRSRRRTEKTGK